MEQILGRENRGSAKRFFKLLWKVRLPILWIIGYILVSMFLTNVGISSTEYTAQMFAGNVDFAGVILPFLIVTVINVLVIGLRDAVKQICEARISRNARRVVWKRVVKLPLSYYTSHRPGELITRVTNDVGAVASIVLGVFVSFITTGYTSLALLGKIGEYDTKLMVTLLLALPLEFLIAFVVGKLFFGINDILQKKSAEMTQSVKERTGNYLLIKASNTQEEEYEKTGKVMKDVYRYSIISSFLNFASPMYSIAYVVQFLIIVLVGRSFYSNGTLTLAQWIAYYGFSTQLFNALSQYCNYWTSYKANQGAAKRIAEIMDTPEEDVDSGETVETLHGDITLTDVSFAYPNGKQVFENLSLTIPAGRVVAVVGPSGSGKTTLLNLIERMYPIDSGSIYFGDTDACAASLRSFRSHITYLTQECTMFSGTIRDNLLFGVRREVTGEELQKVCADVGLTDFIAECGGLDAPVSEAGASLSGGQKQRIALARALLMDVGYLFLDEATTAMDMRSKQLVWDAIRAHTAGRSVLMIAHDQQTVRQADYIIVVEDGKITAQGECAAVEQQSAYYRQLIGKEADAV